MFSESGGLDYDEYDFDEPENPTPEQRVMMAAHVRMIEERHAAQDERRYYEALRLNEYFARFQALEE